MSWQLEGKKVSGNYIGEYLVQGTVIESRVAYGGKVKHHIRLDSPLDLFGHERHFVSLDHDELIEISEDDHAY